MPVPSPHPLHCLLAPATQMRELDRFTIENVGIPGMVLMENAGRQTLRIMEQEYGSCSDKAVFIFVGPGNNGGDGFVIARALLERNAYPHIFLLADPDSLPTDAKTNARLSAQLDIPCTHIRTVEEAVQRIPQCIAELMQKHPPHSMVDAIFGIGLTREVSGYFAEVIRQINSLAREYAIPVLAADIPSGLDSDTGTLRGVAVQADCTVSYGLAKPGHYHHGGQCCGAVHRVDIGIPPQVIEAAKLSGTVLSSEKMKTILQPRQSRAHKGSNGHILLLAGSQGMTGAAILAARGALHSGAGLVSLAVPHSLNPIFENQLHEAMTIPLPHSAARLHGDDTAYVEELCQTRDIVIMGPGLGTHPDTARLVRTIYTRFSGSMVVDADALNILAEDQASLSRPGGPRIFTPHPGEMARLLHSSIEAVEEDRLKAVQTLVRRIESMDAVAIIKGAGTVIAANFAASYTTCSASATSPSSWAINTTGNAGMASGGMGDVLAGMLGGFLGQGYSPWQSACLAVFLHGQAADSLATTQPFGFTAGQVAKEIPVAIGQLLSTITLP